MAITTARRTGGTSDERAHVPAARAALSGALAAAVALGITELLAGLVEALPSLVVLVGSAVIDLAPPWLEDWAIAVFGTADKPALVVGIAILSLAVGALLGALAARRFAWGVAGLAAFGVVGTAAAVADPRVSLGAAGLNAAAGVAAGAVALRRLLRKARPGPTTPHTGRRAFLRSTLTVAAVAAVTAASGRFLIARAQAAAARNRLELPPVPEPLAAPPDAASLEVDGLSPLLTPNEIFYRIDTALVTPRVDASTWRLRIHGMVDRPHGLSFGDLLDMPQVERDITLACVSNRVGGDLVGNARWQGVPLRDILDRAGVRPGATQIVGRAVDGFTVGFPTEAAFDGRDALVALGMNGEPLPHEHGFPARLVVAGLYGYVSATKWLSEIELTTLEAFDAYWVPRGWAKQAPIKTQSRIDVPRDGTRLVAGPINVAGVAWAPTRGISKVEVQVDDRPWEDVRLAEALGPDSWRQWLYEWDASPGDHLIRVRATDGTAHTQTAEEAPPRPDGATGYHTVAVTVA